MNINQVFSLLKKDLKSIENKIKKYALSEVALATKISNHIIFSGGKRVRPAMFLLCAKMCGYEKADLYNIACAIELLHTATLLHDDVIDDAKLRRGKKSANTVWDNKASILSGDFLSTQVFNILVNTRNFEILGLFTKTTLDLIHGELFQHEKARDIKITKEEYFYIIQNKTAILLSSSAVAGAILAEKPLRERNALKSFGHNLGMAFQIIDDMLDYDAEAKKLGKDLLADLKEGRITLPLIHILENAGRADKKEVKRIVGSEDYTKSDIKTIYDLIKKYDSIFYVKETAMSFAKKAVKHLDKFSDCKEKDALLAISDFIIERAY